MMWPRGRLPFAILALVVLGTLLLVLIYIIWAVTLDVRNPDQFKVVKVGDEVEVTYTEALALSVEPASPAQ